MYSPDSSKSNTCNAIQNNGIDRRNPSLRATFPRSTVRVLATAAKVAPNLPQREPFDHVL